MAKNKRNKTINSRRHFLKIAPLAATSLLLASNCQQTKKKDENGDSQDPALGPRSGISNPFTNAAGQPILVIVEGSNFVDMIRAGFTALGGLKKLINNNQDVLVKPNLFEKSEYPWISSLDSLCSLISVLREVTSGSIKTGDMSFEEVTSVYNYLGFEASVNNIGGTAVMFSETQRVRQSTWESSKQDFMMFKEVYNAPVLINFPVLKPHYLAGMTCAIKNNFGTISGSNATITRGYIHNQLDLKVELAEVAALARPDLTIVDARSIVTRTGPFYSQAGPLVQAKKVIMCGDIVATDAYCARLLADNDATFSVSSISKTIGQATALGLGTSDLSQVDIRTISV
jgi:uncharacterized protein (DUF362 family)